MTPYLQTPQSVQQIHVKRQLSNAEFAYMWRNSREYTSTGVSSLHFGHFKAGNEDVTLGHFDNWLINLTVATGYNLKRWQQGIDVMIPKKKDSIRVDKLRTIVLMEPDYNFFNKLIGKWVMANAEKAGSLAPEQFGSRKQKSSIQHAINRQLTTDVLPQDNFFFA
jgi:hypothetical protein